MPWSWLEERGLVVVRRPPNWGSDASKGMNQASYGLAMAFGFVAAVLALFGLGRLIDDWLGIKPWAEVIGSVGGWVLGTVTVYFGTKRGI